MPSIYKVAEVVIKDVVKPVKPERSVVRGKSYLVHYFDGRAFEEAGLYLNGYVHKHKIYIRSGLSKRVEHGVLTHEAYHYSDTKKWLGMYGMEDASECLYHAPRSSWLSSYDGL